MSKQNTQLQTQLNDDLVMVERVYNGSFPLWHKISNPNQVESILMLLHLVKKYNLDESELKESIEKSAEIYGKSFTLWTKSKDINSAKSILLVADLFLENKDLDIQEMINDLKRLANLYKLSFSRWVTSSDPNPCRTMLTLYEVKHKYSYEENDLIALLSSAGTIYSDAFSMLVKATDQCQAASILTLVKEELGAQSKESKKKK